MITRNSVASYVADSLLSGADRSKIIDQMSGWLKDTKSTRQVHFLINDIAKKLVDHKYLFVRITSARQLSESSINKIVNFLRQNYGKDFVIEYEEIVDTTVIGGVTIDTPTGTLDASVKHKLDRLIKGAQ